MSKKIIFLSIICIILIISGCTSSTTTPSKVPTKTPSKTPSIIPPTITPRPTSSNIWDSQFAEDTIPSNMMPGKKYTFSIKVFNVGQMPWTYANHTSIFPIGNNTSDVTLFNPTKVNLTKSQTVKTGQNYTWNIVVTTPIQCGNYTLEFRMINNNTTWFGDTFTKNATVGFTGDEVTFVSKSIKYYQSLKPNSTLGVKSNSWTNVSISANNTGRSSWAASDNIMLGAIDYEPNDATKFNQTVLFHIAPDDVIMPGEIATWKFQLQAPQYPGTYYLKYRMQKDGQWFGNTLNVTITVTEVKKK